MSSLAFAQTRRVSTVGIGLEPGLAADAERGAHALSTVVQGDARFEWVNPAVQARDDGPVREARAIEAKRMFGEAREQLDNLAIPQGMASLEKSIKFYEDSDLSGGVQGLLDALALRAMAAMSKGDKGAFNNDAQRVLAIAPDYAWDQSRLTPAAQSALAALKKKARAVAPTTLEITSVPSTAWAYVDGSFRGVTPVSVPNLAAGAHVVTLSAAGFELVQEKVFAGQSGPFAATLKPSARGKELLSAIAQTRAEIERDDLGAKAGALARTVGAEEVLIAAIVPGKTPKAVLARVLADGRVVGQERVDFTGAGFDWSVPARALLSKDAPRVELEAPRAAGEAVGQHVESHSGRRAVGWVAAAVAVASVGAGIGLGLSAKARAADANKVPQLDGVAYQQAAGQAKLQAGVADGLFALAVVAAGVSIFMLVTGYGSSADDATAPVEDETSVWMMPTRSGAFVGLGRSF